MLRTREELHARTIGAIEGVIGHVKGLYRHDNAGVVRCLIVQTSDWLAPRKRLQYTGSCKNLTAPDGHEVFEFTPDRPPCHRLAH